MQARVHSRHLGRHLVDDVPRREMMHNRTAEALDM